MESEDYEIYEAQKDLIYVKKDNFKSFGKMLVISKSKKNLSINDFELISEEQHKIQLKALIESEVKE